MKMMKKPTRAIAVVLTLALLLPSALTLPLSTAAEENSTESYFRKSEMTDKEWSLLGDLMNEYTSFVVTKHKQLGGSHYAYTEAVSDTYGASSPNGEEDTMFHPNSQLVLVELERGDDEVKKRETVLLESRTGVIRDPDVSPDGTKVLFSWKQHQTQDDYHIYEYDLITRTYRQLTFGLGVADTEPRYLPDGNILFSSTRCIQTVDCWKVPVANLYVCNADGQNIIRLGYDQVHTTYPTVTSDGRVLYTRWDYNDRNQMFVQGVFQMFPDGTNQTEVYGNNSNFPTTLLHTREVPGRSDLYISIASGHHNTQIGKLVMIDTSKGRNDDSAISFILPDEGCSKDDNLDNQITLEGAQYKYPYPLNDSQFLVSCSEEGYNNGDSTAFDICLMDTRGTKVELVSGSATYPASQIVPVTRRTLHERPSMVNYALTTGNYYIGDIYEGDGLKGIERGAAKYLRVVELEFRAYAIGDTTASGTGTANVFTPIATGNGAWDVKKVLGIVPIEEDGSVLFKAPSETALYFQVLDEEGSVIQSMRSWTTLMPGETFSCVGCHEDKNTVPPASSRPTMAMAKGVKEIQPDLWQVGEGYEDYDPYTDAKGFDYVDEIQPIWDEYCTSEGCHNDLESAFNAINASAMGGSNTDLGIEEGESIDIFGIGEEWKYIKGAALNTVPADWNSLGFDDSAWSTGKAPFGDRTDNNVRFATSWNGNDKYIWLRKTFTIDDLSEFENVIVKLKTYFDDNPEFYINGYKFYEPADWVDAYTEVKLTTSQSKTFASYLQEGENVLAIRCENGVGGRMIDTSLALIKRIDNSDAGQSTYSGPFCLSGMMMGSNRMGKEMPLSYLILTGSRAASGTGNNACWVGDSTNQYTNWISGMSQCEMLEPYQFGSANSALIDLFLEEHSGVELTDVELRKIKAWIDLGVPCYGSYEEGNIWNDNWQRWADEYQSKRDYYDKMNELARAARAAGVNAAASEVSISYTSGSTVYENWYNFSGVSKLEVPQKYKSGDKVTVTLPDGQHYLGLTLDTLLGEAIIYVPDGVYTFTLPDNLSPYNRTFRNASSHTITARVIGEDELGERRNLAVNQYDLTDLNGRMTVTGYPHATTNSNYNNDAQFIVRNAIDGVSANQGHGGYPVQSWGPAQGSGKWMQVDFGREVSVDEVVIAIRADFPHDTYFESATLEFSDGTKIDISIEKTEKEQTFTFDAVKTSYVKLTNLKVVDIAGDDWAAITEFEVYGSEAIG